jgi:hypothetical protein
MAWLVVLAVLVAPFLLTAHRQRLAGRLTLTLFWISCVASGIWFLAQARRVEADIRSVHLYPLPETPGNHSLRVVRPSQGSMKGTLRGGAALRRGDLEKLRWSFAEAVTLSSWFDPREHDEPEPGETLLFYVDESHSKDALTLQYRIEEPDTALLKGRTLVVGHDAGARHILRDHAQIFLDLFGWALLAWGVLWMIVQVVAGVRRVSPSEAP